MSKRTKKAKGPKASPTPEQPATLPLLTRITEERRRELAVRIVDLADDQSRLHAAVEQARLTLRKVQGELERLSAIRVSGVEIADTPVRYQLEGQDLVTYRHDAAHLWPDDVRAFGEIARRPATPEELQAARQPELPFAGPEEGQGSVGGPGEVAEGPPRTATRICEAMAPLEPWIVCTLPADHPGPDHVAKTMSGVVAARWPVEGEAISEHTKAAIATGEAIAAGLASGIKRAQDDDPVRRANLIEQGRALWASVGRPVEESTVKASKGEERGEALGDEPSSLDAPYCCSRKSCPKHGIPTSDMVCGSCDAITEIREPTPAELAAIEAAPEEPVPADPQAELDKLIEEQTRDAAKGVTRARKARIERQRGEREAKGAKKAARKGGGR